MGLQNPFRETKFSGAKADREIFIFPVQLTTCRIVNLTRLIHTLAIICVTIHAHNKLIDSLAICVTIHIIHKLIAPEVFEAGAQSSAGFSPRKIRIALRRHQGVHRTATSSVDVTNLKTNYYVKS